MVLKPSEVQTFYDRFGKKQDAQSFYEDPALDDLIAHASFSEAKKVFEFGCGTGRFAARLLSEYLPAEATYVGCDLSRTMVDLATKRLAIYAKRARVFQSGGTALFSVPDYSADRVISTYVLDLMSETTIEKFLLEAFRTLDTGGKVCLVSLTKGVTLLSKIVAAIWSSVFHLRASLVGGCRPISLAQHINLNYWEPEYRNVIIAFGVPSEVLVARVKHPAQQDAAADIQPAMRIARG
jgi:ubiquinone/menaquinone biosynthesis C-methylase UbiE